MKQKKRVIKIFLMLFRIIWRIADYIFTSFCLMSAGFLWLITFEQKPINQSIFWQLWISHRIEILRGIFLPVGMVIVIFLFLSAFIKWAKKIDITDAENPAGEVIKNAEKGESKE